MKTGDYDGVIENCLQALRMDDSKAYAYKLIGEAKYMKQEFETAIINLGRSIQLEKSAEGKRLFGVFKFYGLAKLKIGDFQGAQHAFEKLIEIDSQHPLPYRYMSEVHKSLGEVSLYNLNVSIFEKKNKLFMDKYDVSFLSETLL